MVSDYRALPGVDTILKELSSRGLEAGLPHDLLVEIVRNELARARDSISRGDKAPGLDHMIASLQTEIGSIANPGLRPAINATGVIIHTNLGRAPLSEEAMRAAVDVASGYSNLEYDLQEGERGSRHVHCERLLRALTGAEAALVVNNNASAVFLVLTAFAAGQEVILSRGEAVEIGGGFRIPDVMARSGAILKEVGTTNRTYVGDYEAAITPESALLMRVHTSNFRVVGFTHAATLPELAELGRSRGIPVVDDIGSGALLPTERYGLAHEPMAQESVAEGASLTCFSGDKLLGGPQAGIIVGQMALVSQLKRHPLVRALRVGKMTLAALQVTLLHYLRGEAENKIPVWQMISRPLAELDATASQWASHLSAAGVTAEVVDAESAVGGGSLPGATLPSRAVALRREGAPDDLGWAAAVARLMREGTRPVVTRIDRGALILDPRTVLPGETETLLETVKGALAQARR